MGSAVNGWINTYLRRLWLGEFLQWAADVFAIFCIAFGLSVLAVKLFLPGLWPGILWLSMGLIPAAGFAWYRTKKHQWTRFDAVIRLDQAVKAQGLLMMVDELDQMDKPNEAWVRQLESYESQWSQVMPRIRPKRFATYLALPVLFAIAVCFVPLRTIAEITRRHNSLSQKTTRELSDLVEQMQQQNLLEDPKEEMQLKSEIQKLAEETRYKPLSHEQWEAVDALQERLSLRVNAANSVFSRAANAAAQLKAANEAAEQLQKGDDAQLAEASEKQLNEALEEFKRSMDAPGLSSLKQGKMQKLAQAGAKGNASKLRQKLTKEQSDELGDLKEFLNREQKKLSELKGQCQCKCRAAGDCEGSECTGEACKPGEGGVTRGRADAELTWGREAGENSFKFKEVVLPENDVDAPNDALINIEKAAPIVDPAATAARSSVRQMDSAAGVSTWNRKLNPKHRNIVQKYFDGR